MLEEHIGIKFSRDLGEEVPNHIIDDVLVSTIKVLTECPDAVKAHEVDGEVLWAVGCDRIIHHPNAASWLNLGHRSRPDVNCEKTARILAHVVGGNCA